MRFELWQNWFTRQWRWRLVAANNRIVAHGGESYYNQVDCRHAISLVQNQSAGALIVMK